MNRKKLSLLVIMAVALLLLSWVKKSRYRRIAKNTCYIQVQTDNPKCKGIQEQRIVKSAAFAYTIMYDVCGAPQAYEWGQWCEDCSRRCRRASSDR